MLANLSTQLTKTEREQLGMLDRFTGILSQMIELAKHSRQILSSQFRNIGPPGVQEAICIWGDTRNTFFAGTRIATEARVEIRGRGVPMLF